jgi:hypothetical protein
MAISVACSKCQTVITVPDFVAGTSGKCETCGAPLSIPKPEERCSVCDVVVTGTKHTKDAQGRFYCAACLVKLLQGASWNPQPAAVVAAPPQPLKVPQAAKPALPAQPPAPAVEDNPLAALAAAATPSAAPAKRPVSTKPLQPAGKPGKPAKKSSSPLPYILGGAGLLLAMVVAGAIYLANNSAKPTTSSDTTPLPQAQPPATPAPDSTFKSAPVATAAPKDSTPPTVTPAPAEPATPPPAATEPAALPFPNAPTADVPPTPPAPTTPADKPAETTPPPTPAPAVATTPAPFDKEKFQRLLREKLNEGDPEVRALIKNGRLILPMDKAAELLRKWEGQTQPAPGETTAAPSPQQNTAPGGSQVSVLSPVPTPPQNLPDPHQMGHDTLVAQLRDEMVVDAMHRGATYLLGQLDKLEANGQLPQTPMIVQGFPYTSAETYSRGQLALGVYALLVAGHSTGDPRLHFSAEEMAPHLKALLAVKSDATYVLALQAAAMSQLPNRPEYRDVLKRSTSQLITGMLPDGSYGYSCGADPKSQAANIAARPWGDNSNGQYGLLGVWAAAEDLEIPVNYWATVAQYWRGAEMADGAWPYAHALKMSGAAGGVRFAPQETEGRPTMSCAGLASLFVTVDQIGGPLRLEPLPDPGLDAGLKRVVQDYQTIATKPMGLRDMYYAYGIERVGLASGYKYFGTTNWYRDGAARMLEYQFPNGSWSYTDQTVGTAYGLLFLARGRNPVVFNKLQYDGPWNARPRDSANLARWLTRHTERNINWQIVSFEAQPEDWLDAPVLLITGHRDPKFTPEQIDKLKRFVRAGGMIFSTADGADSAFTESIRRKYAPAICDRLYEMRPLPPEHPIYNIEYKLREHLMGLSNGLRELWVHSSGDLGAVWQRYATSDRPHWQLSENLYFYASGRAPLLSKLQPLTVPDPASAPSQTIHMARLKYNGNWDPEPAAWDRMSRLAKAYHATNLQIEVQALDALDPAKARIVHMTGTGAFTLEPEDMVHLKSFMDRGGLLIADAAGGNEAFSDSFRKMMLKLAPDAVESAITRDHPLFDGTIISSTKLDAPAYRRCVGAKRPTIFEYKVHNQRLAVFSQGDITSGLLGSNTWGIMGYTPETAQGVAWNLLLLGATAPVPH